MNFDPWLLLIKTFDEEIQLAKQEMASYEIESVKNEGNVLERGFDYIKDCFPHIHQQYLISDKNERRKITKKFIINCTRNIFTL